MEGNLGTVAKYDVEFKDGKLLLTVAQSGAMESATLSVSVGAKQVLDALAGAMGGTLPAEVVALIEKALGLA